MGRYPDTEQFARAWEVHVDRAPTIISELTAGIANQWRSREVAIGVRENLWSPSRLGFYLLRQSGVDLTPLSAEIQQLLTSNSPQHRIELRGCAEPLPNGVACYDGRAMYLGCCGEIGFAGGDVARVEFRKGEMPEVAFSPDARGKARIEFTVPRGWNRVGILPVKDPSGMRWLWPESGAGEGWADLQEVRLAIRQGWSISIKEVCLWQKGNPIGAWSERLQRLYLAHVEGPHRDISRCIRGIALHTIGSMHRSNVSTLQTVARDDERVTVGNVQDVTPEGVVIKEYAERARPQEAHPEWSTAIWARARVRVTRAMLDYPASAILGCRGDSVYLDPNASPLNGATCTAWNDTGKCGELRLQWVDEGPRGPVRSWKDLLPTAVR